MSLDRPGPSKDIEHGHPFGHSCKFWRSEHHAMGRCELADKEQHWSCSNIFYLGNCGTFKAYERGLKEGREEVQP